MPIYGTGQRFLASCGIKRYNYDLLGICCWRIGALFCLLPIQLLGRIWVEDDAVFDTFGSFSLEAVDGSHAHAAILLATNQEHRLTPFSFGEFMPLGMPEGE